MITIVDQIWPHVKHAFSMDNDIDQITSYHIYMVHKERQKQTNKNYKHLKSVVHEQNL